LKRFTCRPSRLFRGLRFAADERFGFRLACSDARALWAVTRDQFPLSLSGRLAWARTEPGVVAHRRFTPVRASSGNVTCATFRLRLGVLARDRPFAPKQSAEPGTTGKSASRPARSAPSGRRSGTSPEVCSPTAHASRVAHSPVAANLPDDPASAFRRPPVLRAQADQKAALALAVFRASRVIKAVSLEPADARDGSFDRRKRARALSRRPRIHRSTGRESRCLRSDGRVRPGKPLRTRLRDGSSQFERCRLYLAARCGSCTDASFSAVFRYPLIRLSRGPAGRCFLPSYGKLLQAPSRASSLVRRRSWGSALRSFAPADGWSRRTSAAAK
jgi:hypothetical protein